MSHAFILADQTDAIGFIRSDCTIPRGGTLCTNRRATCNISRYMHIRIALLIRLLKILRQSTTGFALLEAHQCCTQAASCFSWHDIRSIAVYFHKENYSQGCWKLFDSPRPVSPFLGPIK
ncbi:hypothetical protein T265_01781 [Opisthorchis viverrini]|uniref:Uncharacterized protein n=1 Tax=Opisthorchis viverrini TaxID=6198 RepID=A0A075AIT0_OPIVI|nr:hypothetical protein T265_01781 [Opisthorchis viverrini]KER32169.1 hypothetical protein T265_01781 [Opisthorchis viverrini]